MTHLYRLALVHRAVPDGMLFSAFASSAMKLKQLAEQFEEANFWVELQILGLDHQIQYTLPIQNVAWGRV